ncbi:MAG: 23S rRNA (guanosine(2251)-2'-O)-methyltransferase RlmB [Rhodobacteraceae bacterium]|nr:23S rRNA (guanosine(2251)-2'-O)-methyltransferase RlmB [Paracoccaceae bacterium]
MARKPAQVTGRGGRHGGAGRVRLFGLHAVRAALVNPARTRHRLVLTETAAHRLKDAIRTAGIAPDIADARHFGPPVDAGSAHQGAVLEADALAWPEPGHVCAPGGDAPVVLCLDQVTDPQNAGAILRSAEVFGARAVIAPRRHAAPETGALAKAASGALERQPYLRVANLARTLRRLRAMGYTLIGLDGGAGQVLGPALEALAGVPVALVLGAEGAGIRRLTAQGCDMLVKIPFAHDFGSLNVSNAAAVALYAAACR